MARYFLKLSYDGSAYHGWQIQSNADTVQERLNLALSTLLRQPIETTGCGRTDTGVHAREYFAHFDSTEIKDTSERFLRSLNAVLPRDIAVQSFFPVKAEAHARFDASARTYDYHLVAVKDPFQQNRAWFRPYPLELDRMNAAAELLLKHTRYGCFCKGKEEDQSMECTITYANWKPIDNGWVFSITANRFLRNMVRAIVGTLLEVGEGKITLDEFNAILHSDNRSEAGSSVPAHGLYLVRIDYPFLKR